jgi:methyltransferase (TIGR00027 family)
MLGGEPNDVTFVPVDFTREDLRERLREAGHDEASATLFVWSGFAPYLPEDAVTAVLGWVGRHSNPRTSIVFDACWAGAIEAIREYFGSEELKRAVAEVGEPLRWGIPEGRVEETLARFGLAAEDTLDEREATAPYLMRSDGTALGRPYGFGVLMHARVQRGKPGYRPSTCHCQGGRSEAGNA